MKKYYQYDSATGEYLGEIPSSGNPDALPPDYTTTEAPAIEAGFWPFWNGSAWDSIADHRGRTAWATDLSGELLIQTVGELPQDFTFDPPPPWKQDCAIQWNGDEWIYVEDYRGRSGYVDGKHVVIEDFGPLPEGWSDFPPPAEAVPDTRTEEEKRRADYTSEADPILQQALGYQAEAEALRLVGKSAEADEAEAKALPLLAAFLDKKQEIRARYEEK